MTRRGSLRMIGSEGLRMSGSQRARALACDYIPERGKIETVDWRRAELSQTG